MKLVLRLALIFMIFLLPGMAAGEVIGKNDQEVQAVADPLLDSMLTAMDKGDFDLYVRNYDAGLKMLFNKERFSKMKDELQAKLGKYKSRKYLGFMTKGKSNQVLWLGKFDKSDDDVLIRLVVTRKGGKDAVMGLYFQ